MATNAIENGTKSLPYFVEIAEDGRWVFHLDAHMLATFSECEQKFYYRHILHLRPKGMATALSIGSWWSQVMEDFYKDMAEGKVSQAGIMANALQEWIKFDMDKLKDFHPKAYEAFARNMTINDIKKEVPSVLYPLIDVFGNDRQTLPMGALRMATRYYEANAEHDAKNWKIISTEAGFGLRNEVLVYEDNSVVVYWVGKPDLVIYSIGDEQLQPLDHKTTDYIKGDSQKKWKPHPQTAGYIFAVGLLAKQLGYDHVVDRCVINLCGKNEPSDSPRDGKKKPRYTRIYPSYSQDELAEFCQQVGLKVGRLRWCLENNRFAWKESSCHLYAGCEFRGIDSVKADSRNIFIKADYNVVEPWQPYSVEEED